MSTFSNPLTEYSPQLEFEYAPGKLESGAGVFDDHQEMELAARLLEVTGEAELDYFLGDLIQSAGNAIGALVKSPIGRAIGGALKTVAGAALPIAGTALGGMVGGPLGAQIGGGLASMAGHALGLELEGLSAEDREFEAARQFVRFAGETVRNAVLSAPGANPDDTARAAAIDAARIYVPGLVAAEPGYRAGSGGGAAQGSFSSEYRRRNMHDIDRTQQFGYGHQMEAEAYPQAGETEALSEAEVNQYAAQLMEMESEEELENFLGDIVGAVTSAAGSLIPGPAGQMLGGLLKGAAKKLLPMAGQALGGMVGGPIGARLGGALAGQVAGSMEMEAEEAEWEAAQNFVRFAAQAASNLAQAPEGQRPDVAATQAVTGAAQTHAPELLTTPPATGPSAGPPPWRPPAPGFTPGSIPAPTPPLQPTACRCGAHHQAGHWYRRGNKIVLIGA